MTHLYVSVLFWKRKLKYAFPVVNPKVGRIMTINRRYLKRKGFQHE